MNKYIGIILFLFIHLFSLSFRVYASNINLQSCSQSDVSAAINSAVDGDTISVPAGSCKWDANPAVVIDGKNITLQGAGIGQTIISISAINAFQVSSNQAGKAFRITGFTFRNTINIGIDDPGGAWGPYNGVFEIFAGKNFRIDHNEFQIYSTHTDDWMGTIAIKIRGNYISGVIDHNRFVNHPSQLNSPASEPNNGCIHAAISPSNGTSGTWPWELATQIGNPANVPNTVIVAEDNYFREAKTGCQHESHAMYGGDGNLWIFRHNEVRNMNVDNHGYEATNGGREFEISNNDWIVESGQSLYRAMHLRGGTGVIYGNSITGSYAYGVWLTNSRVGQTTGPGRSELYGGVPKATCCNTTEGYPCVDQIGRGQETGTSPNKSQTLDPLYIWNNFGGTGSPNVVVRDWGLGSCGGHMADYIQEGRDYYDTASTVKPGYTAYPYPHPLQGNMKGAYLIPKPPEYIRIE